MHMKRVCNYDEWFSKIVANELLIGFVCDRYVILNQSSTFNHLSIRMFVSKLLFVLEPSSSQLISRTVGGHEVYHA